VRSLIRASASTLSCVALAAASLAQVGSVLREQRINELSGGFSGALADYDGFGESLAPLDDLNGDGVRDLAVGAIGDDEGGPERGAVWILFLKKDGTVLSQTKIGNSSGGLAGALARVEQFGLKLASIGDLDGDGLQELAVTSQNARLLRVLFLDRDGTVRTHTQITPTDSVFGGRARPAQFEFGGIGGVGDLDGDGTPDLAWGAPYTDWGRVEDAGAVWILHMNPDGTAKSARKITTGQGGFTGSLAEDDYFGMAIRPLGDVNADGHVDLGVLDYEEHGTLGRLWILFLDENAQVVGHRTVTGNDFMMLGQQLGHLGYNLDVLGDLDGDGIAEVVVHSFGFDGSGGVAIGFLGSDGSLRKRVAIGNASGGLPFDSRRGEFGWSLAWLGDLDGDGTGELAVGDHSHRGSGVHAGAVSVLSLDPDASRNGSGVNSLLLSQDSEPALGRRWSLKLHCSGRGGGLATVAGFDRPLDGVLLRAGELLVDAFSGEELFRLVAPHAGVPVVLSGVVPNQIALLNQVVHVQGLCSGLSGARLSNALDVRFGR
jgi:hypothetical protein